MDNALQDIVDALADRIGRPVAVEDRRWRLLAFSAHTAPDDRVRQASILRRAAPAQAAEWLESFGIAHASGLVDTPPNEEIGLGPRTCAPIRHDGVLLGYVWVIPSPEPLDEDKRRALMDSAVAAATPLWQQRMGRSESASLLTAILEEEDDVPRDEAAIKLRQHLEWPKDVRCAVAIATVDQAGGTEAFTVGGTAARQWSTQGLIWRASTDQLTVLAALSGGHSSRDLVQTLRRVGAARVGAASAATLGDVRRAYAQADNALTVVTAIAEQGPAATAEDLGAWLTVTQAWKTAGRPSAPPERLLPLLRQREGPDLLRALEATLDRAGDVTAAAEDLHIHRATLYRRLARITELTGFDLRSGDDVLSAHFAIRTWRLAEGSENPPAFSSTDGKAVTEDGRRVSSVGDSAAQPGGDRRRRAGAPTP